MYFSDAEFIKPRYLVQCSCSKFPKNINLMIVAYLSKIFHYT
jgi:hypothetical protein